MQNILINMHKERRRGSVTAGVIWSRAEFQRSPHPGNLVSSHDRQTHPFRSKLSSNLNDNWSEFSERYILNENTTLY